MVADLEKRLNINIKNTMTTQDVISQYFNFNHNLEVDIELNNDSFSRTYVKLLGFEVIAEETAITISFLEMREHKGSTPRLIASQPIHLANRGEIPVLNADYTPAIDSDTNEPIMIAEALLWKKLGWEGILPQPIKTSIENSIKAYYGLPTQPIAFVLPN